MTEHTTGVPITLASITDRGLSEKRPLNEDSFLADKERRIFAVADGVGGAEAGEVASQTAIEVLDEAFRHQGADDDIEDLMEIAIQRANTSIHQMSREHTKLSMMATTIVALHLDGRHATIGHVGDSRLYRLAPDGRLHRETADHSIVEEEVRAGRMTPQQAATHPSRNVISRALGADTTVEVDMKTMDVEDGTIFLLCSDGITRHINDEELREVVDNAPSLDAACEELKRRCFERGAEDNLTAVLILVGEEAKRNADTNGNETWDDERTIMAQRSSASMANTAPMEPLTPPAPRDLSADGTDGQLGSITIPPPRKENSTVASASSLSNVAPATTSHVAPATEVTQAARAPQSSPPQRSAFGRALRLIGFLLLLSAVGVGAFLGGMSYHRFVVDEAGDANATGANSTSAVPSPSIESAEAGYLKRRRAVDSQPSAAALRMSAEMGGDAMTSENPEFLYLYGRALLLSGKPQEAVQAFNKAVEKANADLTPENGQLKFESRLATAAAMLRTNQPEAAREANRVLDDVLSANATTALPSDASGSPASAATSPAPLSGVPSP
ncbi:MAG TPA: protein phosphatase 2C domain-containing protein [Pyrinomonadaceae bacterium]|jgi:protein phosphatase|nr:protein phosphatase 2C domain-containing protein [Pyrinomonadaceae bacterium]